MKRLLLALAAMLSAWPVAAAVLPATPTTFPKVFASAQPGDTVALAPGAYGSLDLSRKLAAKVTVACADPTKRPVLAGIYMSGAANVTATCLDVAWKPDAKATTWTPAVTIGESDHITLSDVRVTGGPAVTGVARDFVGYTGNDGNVLGLPTGYGVQVRSSTDVTLEAVEVSSFYKGIVLQGTKRVTIRRANVHDTRTTSIVGSNNSDLLVTDSDLHDVQPWAWGLKTPAGASYGDHGDFLALWSDANQTTPNANIQIVGNRMIQAKGTPILGMWLEGSAAAPFTDAVIRDNLIVVNNLQGIGPLSYCKSCLITGNALKRADGSGSAGQSPTVLLRGGSTAVTVAKNILGAPVDDKSGGVNDLGINTVITGPANIFSPAPVIDARDAQIADLNAKLAAANATISTLQAQAITSAMALKTAQDAQAATQAALDGALSASATLRASLAAIETQAAQARGK